MDTFDIFLEVVILIIYTQIDVIPFVSSLT